MCKMVNRHTVFWLILLYHVIIPGQLWTQGESRGGLTPIHNTEHAIADYDSIRNGMGKTWAVLIANSKYVHWSDLQGEPYRDVELLESALEAYEFDRVIVKKDLNAESFEPFLKTIYGAIKREGVSSLLIYYAGHGEYDAVLDKGYWIPVDATVSRGKVGYLKDTTLLEYMALFNNVARHVLLLADCCFSGTLLQRGDNTRSGPSLSTPEYLYNLKVDVSRKSAYCITSGRRRERTPARSKFSRALEDLLKRNTNLYLGTEEVSYDIKKTIRWVLKQAPQAGPLSTHEFGQFVFIRRAVAVNIITTPWTRVYIGTDYIGQTPLTTELKVGEYEIRFVMSTHSKTDSTITRKIKISQGEPFYFSENFNKAASK